MKWRMLSFCIFAVLLAACNSPFDALRSYLYSEGYTYIHLFESVNLIKSDLDNLQCALFKALKDNTYFYGVICLKYDGSFEINENPIYYSIQKSKNLD